MKPIWLIVEDSFPDDLAPLLESLRKANITVSLIKSNLYFNLEGLDNLINCFWERDCILYYGPLSLAKYLHRKSPWIPGVYYNIPRYECVAYYSVLGKYLLNSNYIMLPWGELIRQKEFLYDKLGTDGAVFVRPNRGDKIFTGQLVYKERYEETLSSLNVGEFSDDELIIVAEPQNIQAEWRFVVARERVLTGSLYKKNNIVGSEASFPLEAQQFAETIAKEYKPDSVYVVDVGLNKSGDYRLVEVGSFSCAGLYKCNTDIIVDEVSKIAIEDWKDVYEI